MELRIRRLIADIIDVLTCALASVILTLLPAYLASGMKLGKIAIIALFAIMTFVFFQLRDLFGTSVGKKRMKLKLVSWDGKSVKTWRRVRRNLTLLLFPLEIMFIVFGFDTLGDHLSMTSVVRADSEGVPPMKKGNAAVRTITLALFFSVLGALVIYFGVSSLRITGSEAYHVIEDYMESDEIKAEYGSSPIWSVEAMDSSKKDKIVYSMIINGKNLDVTTVKIGEQWFVYGLQSETVEKVEKLISKTVSDKTQRYALADIDMDGLPELLEYFRQDNSAHINVYSLESSEVKLTLDTKAQSNYLRGDWRVYIDADKLEEERKKEYRLVGIYSSYSDELSEKYVCSAIKSGEDFTSIMSFKQSSYTEERVDSEQNSVKYYETKYYFNEMEVSPSDYFSCYDSFFEKYQAVSEVISFKEWEAPKSGENGALQMAIELMTKDEEKKK